MLDNVVQTQICTKCKAELPATSEFFSKRARSKSGFQYNCKACEKQHRKDNPEKIEQWRETNPDYQKQYYKDNTEKFKRWSKKWSDANPEKMAAKKKLWHEANPEYRRLYYEANPEKFQRWNKANPEKCCINVQRRRAMKKSLISDFTIEQWEACLLYFDHKDAYTGLPLNTPSQDHIVPVSKGGNYTVSNIIPCEPRVNSSKRNKDMLTWFRKQAYYDVERENKILGYVKIINKTKD